MLINNEDLQNFINVFYKISSHVFQANKSQLGIKYKSNRINLNCLIMKIVRIKQFLINSLSLSLSLSLLREIVRIHHSDS